MYQGNNPTALKSQQAILETMLILLKNKSYPDISISEICEQSGVSRQTFYKLFETKENLLLSVLQNAPFAKQDVDNDGLVDLREICVGYAKFVFANQDLIKMLIQNELMRIFYRLMYDGMSSCRQSLAHLGESEREYAVEFLCAGLCRLTQSYLNQDDEFDEPYLADLAYRLLSGQVYLG